MIATALVAVWLVASPGPLDYQGGHNDTQGQYHLHAGSSRQFRYLDARGQVWEGNTPRSNQESPGSEMERSVWIFCYLPFILVALVTAAVLYLRMDRWLEIQHHRWRKWLRQRTRS